MVGGQELEKLRQQKELLVLECDAGRQLLLSEWQRLRSPDFWINEAAQAARRHPWLTATLGAAAGVATIRAWRRPREMVGWLRWLGSAIAIARSLG